LTYLETAPRYTVVPQSRTC